MDRRTHRCTIDAMPETDTQPEAVPARASRAHTGHPPGSVLVIGATGMLGRPVTRGLLDAGFRVRAMVRDQKRAEALLGDDCELVRGDLRVRWSIDRALEGVDAVYVNLSNPMVHERPPWDPDYDGTLEVIDAAQQAGVKRVLRLSVLGAPQAADQWWVARAKTEADHALQASGLAYTIFRPTWFMESICAAMRGPHLLCPRTPDDPLYWIAGEDYARMVVEALRRDDAQNMVYEVQGPEPLSVAQAFKRFARVWRNYIIYTPVPRLAMNAGASFSPKLKYMNALLDMTFNHMVNAAATVNAHELHEPTTTVEQFARNMLHERELPVK